MPVLQIYEGEVEPWLMSDYCTDTVPVLLRRATFCRAFAADAKDFRSYNSWVRALYSLLQRQPCTRLCLGPPLNQLHCATHSMPGPQQRAESTQTADAKVGAITAFGIADEHALTHTACAAAKAGAGRATSALLKDFCESQQEVQS